MRQYRTTLADRPIQHTREERMGCKTRGQSIICWCGDGPEGKGGEIITCLAFFGISNGCKGASAALVLFLEARLRSARAIISGCFATFGFCVVVVVVVFRRIYSHVKQVPFF